MGLIANRLKFPVLVGYLTAGVILGSNTPGFVADMELSAQLAEIGVILLMFGVGLHFSLDDLLAVRRIALPGALVQIAVATAFGAIVAASWGWNTGGRESYLVWRFPQRARLCCCGRWSNAACSSPSTDRSRLAGWWSRILAMVLVLVLLPPLRDGSGCMR